MEISSIASITRMFETGQLGEIGRTDPLGVTQENTTTGTKPADVEKAARVAQQFEAILTRQILSESMKTMLEAGPSGQVYGYMLTDALADAISKGDGLGLSPILKDQLLK